MEQAGSQFQCVGVKEEFLAEEEEKTDNIGKNSSSSSTTSKDKMGESKMEEIDMKLEGVCPGDLLIPHSSMNSIEGNDEVIKEEENVEEEDPLCLPPECDIECSQTVIIQEAEKEGVAQAPAYSHPATSCKNPPNVIMLKGTNENHGRQFYVTAVTSTLQTSLVQSHSKLTSPCQVSEDLPSRKHCPSILKRKSTVFKGVSFCKTGSSIICTSVNNPKPYLKSHVSANANKRLLSSSSHTSKFKNHRPITLVDSQDVSHKPQIYYFIKNGNDISGINFGSRSPNLVSEPSSSNCTLSILTSPKKLPTDFKVNRATTLLKTSVKFPLVSVSKEQPVFLNNSSSESKELSNFETSQKVQPQSNGTNVRRPNAMGLARSTYAHLLKGPSNVQSAKNVVRSSRKRKQVKISADEQSHLKTLSWKKSFSKVPGTRSRPKHLPEEPVARSNPDTTSKTKVEVAALLALLSNEESSSSVQDSAAFRSKRPLKRQSADQKKFPCDQCSATFKTRPGLKQHLGFHSDLRPFSCSQCSSAFKTRNGLKHHLRSHSDLRPFLCSQCSSAFKTKQALSSHLLVHSEERPFLCSQCSSVFKTREALSGHLLVHSEERPFLCSQCPKRFKRKITMRKHLTFHSNEKAFSCAECPANFRSDRHLKSHSKIHSDPKPFSCKCCSAVFKTKTLLKNHFTVHVSERQFTCTHCAGKFKSERLLKSHLMVHSDVRPFSCPQCSNTFKSKLCLKSHLKFRHSDERLFSCAHCSLTLKTKECLKRHLATHLPKTHPVTKPFSCANCPGTFRTKSGLRRHLKVHSDRNGFVCSCSQCNATFKTYNFLQRHYLSVHSEICFECALCSAKFMRKSSLKSHILLVHMGKKKKFRCSQCHVKFQTKRNLRQHLVCHSDVRPYVCAQCSFAFKRIKDLKRHVAGHANKKPFLCTYCGRTFKSEGGIKYHVDHTHKEDRN